MKIYTGDLFGGPDAGNRVSASASRIKTKTTTEMWLDGEDKPSTFVVETGSYYWIPRDKCFKWYGESVDFSSKRQLQAA